YFFGFGKDLLAEFNVSQEPAPSTVAAAGNVHPAASPTTPAGSDSDGPDSDGTDPGASPAKDPARV
ncbi:PTS alpha-glucoside transporter subunit IIA, partial [Streptomyces anulatus]